MSDSHASDIVLSEPPASGVATASPKPPKPPKPPEPEDVSSALRFLHLCDARTGARLSDVASTVQALAETLIAQGQLPLAEYEKRKRLTVLRESERSATENTLRLTNVDDKYALADLPQIDCASRLALCKRRCCSFTFALSIQDLDERVVRWEYGRPYAIAKKQDGSCVHLAETGCDIYAQRPAVCRTYDCRDDARIWKDFERRIPAD